MQRTETLIEPTEQLLEPRSTLAIFEVDLSLLEVEGELAETDLREIVLTVLATPHVDGPEVLSVRLLHPGMVQVRTGERRPEGSLGADWDAGRGSGGSSLMLARRPPSGWEVVSLGYWIHAA
jgi:hypothetical protein